jgi:hypothetical protein
MATAPTVQTLDQVMAELAPGYQTQQAIIDKQQAGLGAKYGAQKQGLEAQKVQGFNTINNQATGRGMSFSGIPLDEQATYLSTKYLPAIAATDQQQNEEDLKLQMQRADLTKEQRNTALSKIDNQTQSLNSWNLQQMQQEAQARENQLNRDAQARLQSQQIAATRSNAASAKSVSPNAAAIQFLSASTGKDGYVSPTTFKTAKKLFMEAGGSNADFMNNYWYFTGAGQGGPNQANWKSYYYG